MASFEQRVRGERVVEFDEVRIPLDHAVDVLARTLSNRGRFPYEVVDDCKRIVHLCDALLPALPDANFPEEREELVIGINLLAEAARDFIKAEGHQKRGGQHLEVIPYTADLDCMLSEEPLMYGLTKYRRIAALPGDAGEEYHSPIEEDHKSWRVVE